MESDIYEMMGTRVEGPPEAPPFDKRAWAERKRQERQEAFARADAAALRANSDPAALESYLRVAAALPHHSAMLALPQNQPNAPLYPAGGAPGSRPGALPHFGRPRYLGPPPRARSTAG